MDRNSLVSSTPVALTTASRPLIWIKTCAQSSIASNRLTSSDLQSATPTNASVKMFAGSRVGASTHRLTPHPDTIRPDFFDDIDTPVLSYKGSSWTVERSRHHQHHQSCLPTPITSIRTRAPHLTQSQKPDMDAAAADRQQEAHDSDDQESDFLDTPIVPPGEHTHHSHLSDRLFVIKNDSQLSASHPDPHDSAKSQTVGQYSLEGYIPILIVTEDVRK